MAFLNKLKENYFIILPMATCCSLPFWPLPLSNMLKTCEWYADIRIWMLIVSTLFLLAHFFMVFSKKYLAFPISYLLFIFLIIVSLAIITYSIYLYELKPLSTFLDLVGTTLFILYYCYEAFSKEKRTFKNTTGSIRHKIISGNYKKVTRNKDEWKQKQRNFRITSVSASTFTLFVMLLGKGDSMMFLCAAGIIFMLLGDISYGSWIYVEND